MNEEQKKDIIDNKNEENKLNINKLENEIKLVDHLIKISNDRLLEIAKEQKENNNLFLTNDDLKIISNDKNNNLNLIGIKSKSGIKIEKLISKDSKDFKINKKYDKYNDKDKHTEEYSNIGLYPKKYFIISNNNDALSPFNIDLKNDKEKQKQKENESLLNNNKNNNIENYFGENKGNNDINIEEGIDTIISNVSLMDNIQKFNNFNNYINHEL